MTKLTASGFAILLFMLFLSVQGRHAQADTVHLPKIAHQPRCEALPPTPFGVEMYGQTGESSPYYAFLLESGARWVRAPINWRQIEPANVLPSQYNWAHADRVISAARDICLHMIVTHEGDPDWVKTDEDAPLDEVGMVELAEYLGALVERYDGDGVQDAPGSPVVRHWEIYNEPDQSMPLYGTPWGFAGAAYAKMLSIAYPAIKTADPQARVLFGGIAYDWYKDQPSPFFSGFLDDVLEAGGGDYFDIMNFHTYPPYAENWASQGPGLYEKTQSLRAKLARYELDKPFFITETAHHSNPTQPDLGGSHEAQMRFIPQLYAQALAAEVEVLIWFALADPGGDYPYDSGLVTHGSPVMPKPAFAVYQTVVNQLSSARFVRRLTAAETRSADMEAYHFANDVNATNITVAWLNPVQSEEREMLTLVSQEATVRNIVGQTIVVLDADDGNQDGQVSVEVTGRAIYITTAR